MCLSRRDDQPTGTCYLILTAREMRTSTPGHRRMRYGVERIELWGWDESVRVEGLVWDRRSSRL